MKKNYYAFIFLIALSFAATAQMKNMDFKWKNNFMQRLHHDQNFVNRNEKFGLKINPYWMDVDAPHTSNSYVQNVKVPAFNCVWATVNYDSLSYNANKFLRTADGGKTWRYDTINAPAGYGLISIAPIDGNTCYAAMYNSNVFLGGGIFKTINGGATWKQLEPGKLFDSSSFPEFVYFFDAQHGIAVGDNNGDTSTPEIYTTGDAGKTWKRVPKQNIPPTIGSAYSNSGSAYAVFKNTFWFRGYDNYGNSYTYRSDDFGNHWQLFSLSTLIYDFVFTDKLNGLGVSFDDNGPHEVVTHDGGKTWNNKSFTGYLMGGWVTQVPYTHTLVSTLPGPGLTPVYGSSYSNDYGATWNLIDSGINAEHTQAQFLNSLEGWTGRAQSSERDGGMFKWKLKFSLGNFSFTANRNDNNVLLNWQVENETGNNYYSVERSADGVKFSAIGQVKSYNDPQQQYIFEDNNSPAGQQYYRLKQVNNAGDVSYSDIKTIDFAVSKLKLYPNPVTNTLRVEGLNSNANTKLSVIDVTGKLVQHINTGGTNYIYNVQKLAAGSYYLKVETDKKITTLKFVKQ